MPSRYTYQTRTRSALAAILSGVTFGVALFTYEGLPWNTLFLLGLGFMLISVVAVFLLAERASKTAQPAPYRGNVWMLNKLSAWEIDFYHGWAAQLRSKTYPILSLALWVPIWAVFGITAIVVLLGR
jgi:hypothetical protein